MLQNDPDYAAVWNFGANRDGWLAVSSGLAFKNIAKVELQLHLPLRGDDAGKTLTAEIDNETLAVNELRRGGICVVSIRIPVWHSAGNILLTFSAREEVREDARNLGAVLVSMRLNGQAWQPTSEVLAPAALEAFENVEAAPPNRIEGLTPAMLETMRQHADVWRYFDPAFYREQLAPEDPLINAIDDLLFHHYLIKGWRARLNPLRDFDTAFYLSRSPKLEAASLNPLVHWVRHGQAEGRARFEGDHTALPAETTIAGPIADTLDDPTRALLAELFDEEYYLSQMRGRLPPGMTALDHYLRSGWQLGLDPSTRFSTSFYLNSNPEIRLTGTNPLLHFVRHGMREKRPGVSYVALRMLQYRPLVTVIVPNYNHAQFLPERLRSIFAQTYRHVELVLMDDCSSDDSREVLDRLATESPFPVRKMYNETNSGSVFAQWAKGLEAASGELVWICESDDTCEPDLLERLVPCFADRGTMLAFGRIQLCDQEGVVNTWLDSYRENAEPGIWKKPLVRSAKEWFCGAFGCNNMIANVGGALMRRQPVPAEVWSEARRFRICGDWFLYVYLAQGGKIAYEPEAISYFRQHGRNTSASNFDKLYYYQEHERVLEAIESRWAIPAKTRDRFIGSMRQQWQQHGMQDAHGEIDTALPMLATPFAGARHMHVVIGSLGFTPGGGEFFPIHLANALVRLGLNVSMLCVNLVERNDEMMAQLDPRVAVYDGAEVKVVGPAAFLGRIGGSVLHSHMISIDDHFYRAPQPLRDFPYVVSLHGSHDTPDGNNDLLLMRMLREVAIWVYTANKNLRIFGRAPLDPGRVRKLPNAMPVDVRDFDRTRAALGIDPEATVFTFVARGVQQKGWRAAVEAVRRLCRDHPERKVHLILVGEGPKTTEVRATVEAGLPVSFLGFQLHVNGLYRISDVAIVPTRFPGESYPLCVIQALQEGVPIIATDIGEIANMITEGEDVAGELLPNLRDSQAFFDATAEAMLRMTDPAHRARCAALARRLGPTFDMDVVAGKYVEIYQDACVLVEQSPATTTQPKEPQ